MNMRQIDQLLEALKTPCEKFEFASDSCVVLSGKQAKILADLLLRARDILKEEP